VYDASVLDESTTVDYTVEVLITGPNL
jgi:hypothetical protein